MQAIITKYLSATNTRGSRIKATCDRGSIIVSYPHELSGSDVHVFAANALVARFADEDSKTYGTPRNENPWLHPRVCGGLPSGDVAHVFTGEGAK